MDAKKYNNLLKSYKGHIGPVTIQAILDNIPKELHDRLTGYEIGLIMNLLTDTYRA